MMQLIYPSIQHKMHQNRRTEKELLNCLLCQEIHKEEYETLKKEREKDPAVIRQKAFNKMHRKPMTNPITEKQIKKKYGKVLGDEVLEDGVVKQKLHWTKKACFGNEYRIYEKDEIERYYHELKTNKKDDDNVRTKKSRKRKRKDDNECQSSEPKKKKHKTDKM
eukprot:428307_1